MARGIEVGETAADEFDVVVVGCGVAGLSAAVAALEAGARTAVLERAPEAERGGNTRYTTAALRMVSETEISPDFETVFADNAGYHLDPAMVAETAADYANWPSVIKTMNMTDPELVSSFAERIPPTIAWMKQRGITFGPIAYYGLTQRSSPRIGINGGGLSVVETFCPLVEKLGGRFHYETTAERLACDESGAVTGVVVRRRGSGLATLRASSVILACGGFQGNPEMVAHYLGDYGRYLRPVARGGYYNKGEGVRMGLAIGAAPAGDFSDYHAQPIDPRSGVTEPIIMIFPQGLLVNQRGDRFVDEAPGTVDAAYEPISRQIARQPGGIAYVILDGRIDDIAMWQRCVWSDQPPVTADSLAALAAQLNVPAARLAATVDAYNAACQAGDFDATRVDGLATRGLYPPKSNWARPIDRAPFRAYPIISSNTFTFGGLKVDPDARVLDTHGEPIRGLYAAGETMGLYYGRYPGATSVLRGAVFGRLAGEHAGARAGGRAG